VQDSIPYNDYYEYYGPDFRLHLPVSNMENLTTPQQMNSVRQKVRGDHETRVHLQLHLHTRDTC
jgi:histone deacetylase 1/2